MRIDQPIQSEFNHRFMSFFANSTRLPHIIMLGKPGAGKSTLSQILERLHGYVHISIGAIHRVENAASTEVGLKIRGCIERGEVFGNEMVAITRALLNKKLTEIIEEDRRFVLDNFPTAPSYLPYMQELITKHRLAGRIILIVPEISNTEVINRLFFRVVCSNQHCGHTYNLAHAGFAPINEGKCDYCGFVLSRRLDEYEDERDQKFRSYQKKMQTYDQYIFPVIRELSQSQLIECFFIDNELLRKQFLFRSFSA